MIKKKSYRTYFVGYFKIILYKIHKNWQGDIFFCKLLQFFLRIFNNTNIMCKACDSALTLTINRYCCQRTSIQYNIHRGSSRNI